MTIIMVPMGIYGETNFTNTTTYRSNMLLVMVNQLCQQEIKLDNMK